MPKWYIEFVEYGEHRYMGGIEAPTGNDAIKKLRESVLGINRICGVWHDDEEETK